MTPIYELDAVTLTFGSIRSLNDVSITVEPHDLLAVIGPNGAGKTSLFNCISGVYRPQLGRMRLRGVDVSGWQPHRIAAAGVARTFQNVDVFPALTVSESLMLGRHLKMRSGVLANAVWFGRSAREERVHRAHVENIMDLMQIAHLRDRVAGDLPHGIQKRVELARALAMEPELLLLDEPVAGMNHEETAEMTEIIQRIHRLLGLTTILVEHDMKVVMSISTRVAVLDFGELIANGTPAGVMDDPAVRSAYLG